MPPLLPFPVLIYENKIPVNSCSINTKQLWGQAFTYTAQFNLSTQSGLLQLNCMASLSPRKLCKAVWTHIYKLTLTADTLHIFLCLKKFSFTKSTATVQEHQVNLNVIINAPNWTVEHLPEFFQWRPFQLWTETHLQTSPSVFFTGKQEKGGESGDLRGRETRAGTF